MVMPKDLSMSKLRKHVEMKLSLPDIRFRAEIPPAEHLKAWILTTSKKFPYLDSKNC